MAEEVRRAVLDRCAQQRGAEAAQRGAVAELQAKAADAAATAARALIAKGHDAKADKALVDEAIAGI